MQAKVPLVRLSSVRSFSSPGSVEAVEARIESCRTPSPPICATLGDNDWVDQVTQVHVNARMVRREVVRYSDGVKRGDRVFRAPGIYTSSSLSAYEAVT